MVYAPPRPSDLQAAFTRKRRTVARYREVVNALDRADADAVTAYVAALAAECAALRVRARQATEALERAARGGAR